MSAPRPALEAIDRALSDPPRVTTHDDDLVRTHDEARELLKYAAPGATVVIEPCRPPAPDWRKFTVVLDVAPGYATSAGDAYSLPCLGAPLQRRIVELCERSLKTAVARLRSA